MSVSTDRRPWIENRPTRGLRWPDPRELWQYRELIWFLALRDMKVRYKQAAFGAGWALFQPLAGALVFTLVFRRLARVSSDGLPYPVFAFVGLAAWNYVAGSVTKATQSLVSNSPLVTKVYFPRLIAPMAAVVPGLVDLAVSLVAVGLVLPLFDVKPGWAALSVPAWVALALALSLAVGLWLATLNVRYRDVNHGITLLVQLWLFLSPVAYATSMVDQRWQWLYALNPAVAVIDGFRWAILGAPWPGTRLLPGMAVTLVLLIGGVAFFQRAERRFADII